MIGIEKRTKTVIQNYCQRNGIILNHHQKHKYSVSYLMKNNRQSITYHNNKFEEEKNKLISNICNYKQEESKEMNDSNSSKSIMKIVTQKKYKQISRKMERLLSHVSKGFCPSPVKIYSNKTITYINADSKAENFNKNFLKSSKKIKRSKSSPRKNHIVKDEEENMESNYIIDKKDYNNNINLNEPDSSSFRSKSEIKSSSIFLNKLKNQNYSENNNNYQFNENTQDTKCSYVLKGNKSDFPSTLSEFSDHLSTKIKLRDKKLNNSNYFDNLYGALIISMEKFIKDYKKFSKNKNSIFFHEKLSKELSNIRNIIDKGIITNCNSPNINIYKKQSTKNIIIDNTNGLTSLKLTKDNVDSFECISKKSKRTRKSKKSVKNIKNFVDNILKREKLIGKYKNKISSNSSINKLLPNSSNIIFSFDEKIRKVTEIYNNQNNTNFNKIMEKNNIKKIKSNTVI